MSEQRKSVVNNEITREVSGTMVYISSEKRKNIAFMACDSLAGEGSLYKMLPWMLKHDQLLALEVTNINKSFEKAPDEITIQMLHRSQFP